MTRDEFLAQMLENGRITQAQVARVRRKDEAKSLYRKNKNKMTRAELQAVMDTLFN